jgi:hypothetical protein
MSKSVFSMARLVPEAFGRHPERDRTRRCSSSTPCTHTLGDQRDDAEADDAGAVHNSCRMQAK